MFQEDTVIKRMQTFAQLDPDKDGYVYIDENNRRLPLSRQQIWDLSGRFASKLKRYGVQKGDIICNTLPNSRSRRITDIGILMAGGVTMNGLVLLKSGQDIVRNLQITKCKIILGLARSSAHDVFQTYFTSNHSFISSGLVVVHYISCPPCPHLDKFLALHIACHDDHTSFLNSLNQETVYVSPLTQNDEAYMFTTSGTSGISKLVPRNHRELITIGASFKNVYTTDDVIFNDSLMGWIGGHPHSYFYSGMTIYSQEIYPGFEKRPLSKLWDFLLDEGVSICNLLPLEILQLNEDCAETVQLRKVKKFTVGGQTIPKKVFDISGRLCNEIITLYGSTETGVAIIGRMGNHNKRYYQGWAYLCMYVYGRRQKMWKISDRGKIVEQIHVIIDYVKTGYAGQDIATGMKMVLRDENTQELITEINKYGKLFFKGGTVLRNYFNIDDNNVCALSKDGWYDSSDVGYIDNQGDVYVVGRTCDSIELGPIILYPEFVEEALNSCTGVAVVAIVGIPHPLTVQELCACVVRQRNSSVTEEQILEHYDKIFTRPELKPHKFIFLEQLPVNNNGKVHRKQLQQMATEHFINQQQNNF